MAIVEDEVLEDIWSALYGESWKGLICDESFAHPAKFSRALIRKIYDHVIEEGWANKGDSVVDPFGGVALGALDAMRLGLNWHGCELEEKFVGLGGQNIVLWNDRFSRMPQWGSARLIQGDSRTLSDVMRGTACSVSSPPFVTARQNTTRSHFSPGQTGDVVDRQHTANNVYADETPGQLAAMPEGDLRVAITSPPYANDTVNDRNGIDQSLIKKPGGHNSQSRTMANYGEASGQLGAMKEGDHSIAISSPPWEKGAEGGLRKDKFKDPEAFASKMAEGKYRNGKTVASAAGRMAQLDRDAGRTYGETEGQMGQQSGETFWSASRLILEQLHQVIVPGGHAVFVVKAFVRDKKIVDFPGQWAQLCEAAGFRLLHHHRASLVEHSGTQGGFEQDKEIRVERKSFFRRLAERKGSPRIDHESVLCFIRL